MEKYIDKQIEAAEKVINTKIDDMKEAVKLAREEAKLAQKNAFWLSIIALVGLVSGLLSLIIQYNKQ
jgi:hypothetical protein